MKTKIKILVVLISLVVSISLMSNTYSRYVADTTGNIEVQFAKWKILVNDSDITSSSESNIELTPVIKENKNVAANKFAPSSEGYFDIEIDPSNVEMSFDYTVELTVLNENLPDILISEYSIIKSDFSEKSNVELHDIIGNKITGTLKYKNVASNSDEIFAFEPFTIRVHFKWYDGENATMSDEMDTSIATSSDETTLQIQAKIKFEQHVNETNNTSTPSE